MKRYIDADRLRAVIKRQIRLEELNFAALGSGGQTFCTNTLEWVLKQIDSLQQEQPEVECEEEINKFFENVGMPVYWCNDAEQREFCSNLARHFYELGLNARKED